MKKLLYIGLSFLVMGCLSSPDKLTEKQFTETYFEVISERYSEVDFEITEPLTLTSKYGDQELTHFLDNSYKEYNLEPDQLHEIIERYADTFEGLFELNAAIEINHIVPMIKSLSYVEELNQNDIGVPNLLWEPYNEDLIIVYAEDQGHSFKYLNTDDFDALNIDKDTLLAFAIDNLNQIIPDIDKVGEDGEYGLIAGGDYEANLILFTSIWTKENFDVDGDIVVAIPNRDLIYITGSNNKVGIENLKKEVDKFYNTGNHPISNSFYRWTGHQFEKVKL